MRHSVIFVLTMALASPALGQGLNPAVEGDGSQTQNLQLLDGAVSVTVESSGSLSLNHGPNAVEGSLGITVNELTLGDTSQTTGTDGAPSAMAPGGGAPNQQKKAIAPSLIAPTNAPGATPAGVNIPSAQSCDATAIDPDDIARAAASNYPLYLQQVDCVPQVGGQDDWFASQPDYQATLATSGIHPDQLVSITIIEGAVIAAYGTAN